MSIFSLYPKISYKVNDYDYIRAVDITQSLKIKDFLKNYRGIAYQPYFVKDGEKPDFVAHKFYGDPFLDWIILLSNDIYNIYEDWPKDRAEFENYLIEKYGSIDYTVNTIKYYYDKNKNIIDEITYTSLNRVNRSSESIYEYEIRKNITKSRIKLVRLELIGELQTQLKSIKYKPVQ
jgi:hypothetical protein